MIDSLPNAAKSGVLPEGSGVRASADYDLEEPVKADDVSDSFLVGNTVSKLMKLTVTSESLVPDVKWEDVGGLEDVKKALLEAIQLPLLHKDQFSTGLQKRSGVLLYGPPGTGKTLLANAVAGECSLNLLTVNWSELIDRVSGESEKNVRAIFQKARSLRPCVIFFDYLDFLARRRSDRNASGDSDGLACEMNKVFTQVLAEIDALHVSTEDIFIIGASNMPDFIDPAFLCPGRFDKLIYVGVNPDASFRESVLRVVTRGINLHESVSLLSVAEQCPPYFTGWCVSGLCETAWDFAAMRQVGACRGNDDSLSVDEDAVIVEMDDFMEALELVK
ncbi:peroxisome biogenesis protein 6-like isoform X1 [Dioscorea cayenensis subsp. rotundata]|uniref:Peroxisome biogenesis protein 6-like isoform X1 n=1 Tax=Dioscorea cayennensis subsp. rotundata TaxID=55577 RepID=A0AB40D5B3_DIOCR|nr:peroxisome biogenesis protein 6-like isoform X1 [Dioscorea cayenensis subsp. rotundata]